MEVEERMKSIEELALTPEDVSAITRSYERCY